MTQASQPSWRDREIVVQSDWMTTAGVIALFVFCVWQVSMDIDKFAWGHFTGPVHLQRNFWSIWNKVFEIIAAIYALIFAFKFTSKLLKVACVLMAAKLTGLVLLSCFSISDGVRHASAVSGSVVSQLAFVIVCVEIVLWLRSVVQRDPPAEPPGGER
jgi:hypothetical protein